MPRSGEVRHVDQHPLVHQRLHEDLTRLRETAGVLADAVGVLVDVEAEARARAVEVDCTRWPVAGVGELEHLEDRVDERRTGEAVVGLVRELDRADVVRRVVVLLHHGIDRRRVGRVGGIGEQGVEEVGGLDRDHHGELAAVDDVDRILRIEGDLNPAGVVVGELVRQRDLPVDVVHLVAAVGVPRRQQLAERLAKPPVVTTISCRPS